MAENRIQVRITRATAALDEALREAEAALGGASQAARAIREAQAEVLGLERELGAPEARLPLVYAVDDDPAFLAFESSALEGSFAVRTFPDALSLLASLRVAEELPVAVLVDRAMPGMSGDELVSVLKSERRSATLPLIMLTASSGPERQVEGLELGALDYLVKPLPARVLRAKVEAITRVVAAVASHAPVADGAGAERTAAALRLGLSAREREVADLILDGKSNKVIADELGISLNTVSNHIRNLYEKAGANSRMELAKRLRG